LIGQLIEVTEKEGNSKSLPETMGWTQLDTAGGRGLVGVACPWMVAGGQPRLFFEVIFGGIVGMQGKVMEISSLGDKLLVHFLMLRGL
jgi:hypothetical protein